MSTTQTENECNSCCSHGLLQGTYVRHASYVVTLHENKNLRVKQKLPSKDWPIPDPSGNSEAGSELKIPREGL